MTNLQKVYSIWKEKFWEELNIDLTSPYHLEGSNLTHTLMVFNEALLEKGEDELFYPLIALLHDTGKRKAIIEKDGKKITQGHEGISTYMAVDYLKELIKLGIIEPEEALNILFIINHHGDLMKYKDSKKFWKMWSKDLEKLEWVKTFNKFDVLGRVTENEFIQPEIKVEAETFKEARENNVYITIGVPGVGKSTKVDEFKDKLPIVSRDTILEEYGREKYGADLTYSEIWKNLTDDDQKQIDKILDNTIKKLQEAKKDFLIDMTMTSFKSRKRMLNKIKNSYNVIYLVFLADYKTIIERLDKRCQETGKCIGEKIIINMMKNLQLPLYGEDERITDILYYFS